MKLKGKNAAITGAASGIGQATALKFASEGIANLTLADLNEAGLEETKKKVLEIDPNIGTRLHMANVSIEQDVKAFVDDTVQSFGGIDILFNNAGIAGGSYMIDEMPFEVFQRGVSINLFGVFFGMKYALGYMKAAKKGSIINTSSIGGLVALPNSSDYVAAKHGIAGLTKTAAVEYGPYGVRTNAVCPGPSITNLYEGIIAADAAASNVTSDDLLERDRKMIPFGRQGTAEEIASLVSFLASDEASYLSGSIIAIDGGYTSL